MKDVALHRFAALARLMPNAGRVTRVVLVLILTMLAGCTYYPGVSGRQSWQEEVRLHDGRSLIVERSQTTDMFGRRELGQRPPLSKEDLWFRTPEGREVTWQSDFGPGYEDNLSPLVLDIVDGTPYLITNPTRCHAYNKWGRPNPPYVYFRYDGKQWQRIPLEEVPAVMTQANLIIGGMFTSEQDIPDVYRRGPYIPAAGVDYANRQMSTDTQYLRRIVRVPMKGGTTACPDYDSERYTSPKAPFPIEPDN